jgi:hypothetical protein
MTKIEQARGNCLEDLNKQNDKDKRTLAMCLAIAVGVILIILIGGA